MLARTALALLLLLPAAGSAQDLDKAVSAVVRISGTRDGTPVRGSGFVVGIDRDKATIATASHVIEGVQEIEVTFGADLTKNFNVGIVPVMEAGNPRGLTVFQVRGALPAGVTSLSFDTGAQLQRGEDLFLLGFPQMAMAPLVLRRIFAGPFGNFLQLDLPVGEGFSGAPVLRKGKVVGVVTDEDLQLTFAVKASVAQDTVVGWCFPGEQRTEDDIIFIRICPGTFTMGSAANDPQAYADEKPAHQVTLSEFWIGKTEITNEQYRRFRSDQQGDASLPATGVSWTDAKAACEYFGGRLPTEAEWEYAARASSQTAWSFGDDEKMLAEYAWYDKNSGGTPHPVGTKKPNGWGIYDMYGNVWEWVADWYGTYPAAAPAGPTTGKGRVLRGGSFSNASRVLRSAGRDWDGPEYRDWNFGFRCVRSPRHQP